MLKDSKSFGKTSISHEKKCLLTQFYCFSFGISQKNAIFANKFEHLVFQ